VVVRRLSAPWVLYVASSSWYLHLGNHASSSWYNSDKSYLRSNCNR